MKRGLQRLRRLATILDTVDQQRNEEGGPMYDQGRFTHPCGAPACALGHWAANNPKRWKFKFNAPALKGRRKFGGPVNDGMKEFGLKAGEWDLLFAGGGCGGALTGKQAARYIRRFVRRKEKSHAMETRGRHAAHQKGQKRRSQTAVGSCQ